MQKMGLYRAGPHGCDVARKATWLCHVDACDSLRGVDVDASYIYSIYFNIIYMGPPCIRGQMINSP